MKKIIIIGATSGIGYQLGQIYLEKGYMVGLAGRRVDRLQSLSEKFPQTCFVEKIDITCNSANNSFNLIIKKVGGMDLFLLSSGIGKQNKELNPDIELSTIETNVKGFTRMATMAFDYFKLQNHGHLAVISSIAGTKGIGLAPSYSATKRFQNTYMEALEQLARIQKYNIKFTDIRPGFVNTELLAQRNYPMLMEVTETAKQIFHAIEKNRRVAIIDKRYKYLTLFWQLIPKWIWVRLPL